LLFRVSASDLSGKDATWTVKELFSECLAADLSPPAGFSGAGLAGSGAADRFRLVGIAA